MAKTKPSIDSRKSASHHHHHKSPKKSSASAPKKTPEQLLAEASLHLEQSQPGLALSLATTALSQLESLQQTTTAHTDPKAAIIPALILLAQIHLELGDPENARQLFLRAAELDPNGEEASAEPFLWLAQLSEEGGADSIRWFEQGVQILKEEIQELETVSEHDQDYLEAQVAGAEKKLRAAEALCSMAEVYMTDLSFEDDAEARCEAYVTEALLVAPNSPSTLQTLASVRISQTRTGEAKKALERSIELWQDLPEEDPGIPDYPTRISLARLLMEVEMEDQALKVLERLVLEDDESVEAWYLGGWCHYLQAQQEKAGPSSLAESKEASRGWLRNSLRLCRLQEYEDEKLISHAQELVASLDGDLGGPIAEDEDEEWEDQEDGDDEDESDFEGFPDDNEAENGTGEGKNHVNGASKEDVEMTV